MSPTSTHKDVKTPYRTSNKMHLFIYIYSKIFVYSTCFERIHSSSSGVYISLYIMLTVTSCSASSVGTLPTAETGQLVTVSMICTKSCIYSDMWTADDERCIRSKHVEYGNFRINIYEKVHLVGLSIWLITMHGLHNIKCKNMFRNVNKKDIQAYKFNLSGWLAARSTSCAMKNYLDHDTANFFYLQ